MSVLHDMGRLVQAWCAYLPAHRKLGLVRTMLLAGVGLEAATLALLPGIGGVRARQLVAGGFPHLEALAQAQPVELEEAGFGRARAAQLVEQAEALVRTFDVDPTREPPAGPRPSRAALPALPDPLRLQRARDLQVTPQGDGFTVMGGAAPHRVTPALICDCLDFSSRRRCKHVLAVQLFQGDVDLTRSLGILELLEAEG